MSQFPHSLRAVWLPGASILLILLMGSLVEYELVGGVIFHWIEKLKAKK